MRDAINVFLAGSVRNTSIASGWLLIASLGYTLLWISASFFFKVSYWAPRGESILKKAVSHTCARISLVMYIFISISPSPKMTHCRRVDTPVYFFIRWLSDEHITDLSVSQLLGRRDSVSSILDIIALYILLSWTKLQILSRQMSMVERKWPEKCI